MLARPDILSMMIQLVPGLVYSKFKPAQLQ
jgi:hypothetical protein